MQADPGCFEFFVPAEALSDSGMGPLHDALIAAVDSTRSYIWEVDDGVSDRPFAELISSVSYQIRDQAAVGSLQVIGPGGRVVVFQDAEAYFGRATVRPLGAQIIGASTWLLAVDVLDRLSEFVGRGYEVYPSFGYFELSWLDRQRVLRPAYLFVVENLPETGEPAWRTEVVSPASQVDVLDPDTGLEGWARQ